MCRILLRVGKSCKTKAYDEFIQACADYQGEQYKKDIHELNINEHFPHKDGFGVALLKKDGFDVVKYSAPIYELNALPWLMDKANLMLVHARKHSPNLEVKLVNNHPFYYSNQNEQYVFAHNGTIYTPIENYDKELFSPVSTTDSERYFYAILSKLFAEGKLTRQIINEVIQDWDFSGANFVLSSQRYAWVFVAYKKHEKYYTMKLYTQPKSIIVSSAYLPSLGTATLLKNNSFIKINLLSQKIEVIQLGS